MKSPFRWNTHPTKYGKLILLTAHQSYFKSIFQLLLRLFREVFTKLNSFVQAEI